MTHPLHFLPEIFFILVTFFFQLPPLFLSLSGFGRKEFRGKLAIAITANFINRNTTAEAKVEEISGVAFIFNQKFFLDLRQETGKKNTPGMNPSFKNRTKAWAPE